MPDRLSTDYINSSDYKTLEDKLKALKSIIDDNVTKLDASRKLRYAEVDIEAERESGRLQPDELYVPQHIIDTNIRREQSPYVQYITQSSRAVILEDQDDSSVDLSLLEGDLTKKIRYDGWQFPMFSNIDGFEQNGYGILEVVLDTKVAGGLSLDYVQFCDFAFMSDTRELQAVEMTSRAYYYTRTKLLALCGNPTMPKERDWNKEQVEKVISRDPTSDTGVETSDIRDKSLYKVFKNMFRINGVVHVAWSCPDTCDDWLRVPRPLFIGRRKVNQFSVRQKMLAMVSGQELEPSSDDFETEYPYILYPYLISENNTISAMKGRAFLDQDLQEAVSSLISSTVTQARRAAGMYFSKDVQDPNDDLLFQKNLFFRNGCIVNSKIQAFKLDAPDPGMFSAINMLVSANQNETSQTNFAASNRKDSRKTATELNMAQQQQQILSTVQVVLFSIALTQTYRLMCSIIKSRVLGGMIQVSPQLQQLYARNWKVKPSGDTDVIERQQTIQKMMNSWPIVQNTPLATIFLLDLVELMFPDRFPKYKKAYDESVAQQQSAQQQQMQQLLMFAKQMADGIVNLSQHPDYFSEVGTIHALPVVKQVAQQIETMKQQMVMK